MKNYLKVSKETVAMSKEHLKQKQEGRRLREAHASLTKLFGRPHRTKEFGLAYPLPLVTERILPNVVIEVDINIVYLWIEEGKHLKCQGSFWKACTKKQRAELKKIQGSLIS